MKPIQFLIGVLILAVAIWADPVAASPSFQARIPYGNTLGCTACHTQIPSLNAFGSAFHETNPGDSWTLALSLADSDGDGFANGVELQDPNFQWEVGEPDPGNPALVSNPGDPLSTAVEPATWGRVKELFTTLLRLPRG